jgi:protein-tyrosine phosphatase
LLIPDSVLLRTFILVDTNTGLKEEISQLHIICWPDYLVPDEKKGFPMIENLISFLKVNNISTPIVVHCRYIFFILNFNNLISAGIGRSGTFIAIYNIIRSLEKINEKEFLFLNVFNIVRKLREQRIKMVTTVEQYKFIYECIVKWVNKYST